MRSGERSPSPQEAGPGPARAGAKATGVTHQAPSERALPSLHIAIAGVPGASGEALWFQQHIFDVAQLSEDSLVRASPSLCALLGFGEGEPAHVPFDALVDAPSLPLLSDAIHALFAGQCARADVDIVWTPRGADPVPSVVELQAMETDRGMQVLALSRPRAVTEPETPRLTLHAAFLSVNEPIAIFDKEGNVADFNEALAIFNRFPDRAAMRTMLAVLSDLLEIQSLDGEVLARPDWPSSRALRGEMGRNAEYRLRRKDTGESWLCSFNFSPIRDAAGVIAGAAVIARDITEVTLAVDALRRSYDTLETVVEERTKALVKAKSEADRANAGKTRFLAAASHDLRQPLQSASAYLGALDTLLEDPAAQEMAVGLRNSLEVMAELLNTLLDISRLQSGAIEPNLETFPIADVLRRAMLDHAPAAEVRNLELRMHLSPCTVRTDRALLMRIVENLLSNAIRYTENGHITIGNRLNGNEVILEVSDTGVGIPPESLELIFEEYYQVENTSRDRTRGMGLGLSIVRHLTRLLGHDLVVSSTVGQGTTFSLSLPLGIPDNRRRRAAVRARAEAACDPVILVVDDEPSIRHSLTMFLNAHGMVTHIAHDAAGALELLEDGLVPDLLLTDYRLPGATGSELIRQIRRNGHSDIACIIMTGDTMFSEALPKEAEGCVVMKKPIDCLRLPHIIRETIAARQA